MEDFQNKSLQIALNGVRVDELSRTLTLVGMIERERGSVEHPPGSKYDERQRGELNGIAMVKRQIEARIEELHV